MKRTERRKPAGTNTQRPLEAADAARERIAKRIARAGLCSRREAEAWIAAGRVALNGQVLSSPAVTVGLSDRIEVDGKPLQQRERTRLWLYHKPAGLVTTNRDPQGRRTVFDALPEGLPRVLSVGRLDINTEGLLLLTNDGGLARLLELPRTGWLRRYRVRAHGKVTQEELDRLREGIAVNGVLYGSIEATIDRVQGSNVWLVLAFREGKNREVKEVLGALGLSVNRLIRISYGPFQLGDMEAGEVREIRGRTLRDQLGERLIAESGADFDAPILQQAKAKPAPAARPGAKGPVAKGPSAKRPAVERPDTGGRKRQERQTERPAAQETRKPGKREKSARREELLDRLQTSRPPGKPAAKPAAKPAGKGEARPGRAPGAKPSGRKARGKPAGTGNADRRR